MDVYLSHCGACNSPLREQINRRLRTGVPLREVSRWLKAEDAYLSDRALARHKAKHLSTEVEAKRLAAIEAAKQQQQSIKSRPSDLAALVRDQTLDALVDGRLTVTVQDGLRAQQLIDARVEKQADRSLALQLANILGGSWSPAIEGEYTEVEPGLLGPGVPSVAAVDHG